MDVDTKTPLYNTSDKTSFAYISARDRWPVILTGGIDDVHRAVGQVSDSESDKVAEGKKIVEELARLKYEIQHDRKLSPLPEDGGDDIKGYNEELEKLGTPSWFGVPWLYSECYLYRRVATLFANTQHWKSYDIFSSQKISTFRSSRPAVLELASRYKDLVSQLHQSPAETGLSASDAAAASKLLFHEMFEIALWGNATDLSLLTSLTYEDLQKLQGSEARKKSEKNILVNDLGAAYDVLSTAKEAGESERRVDIILDNAGFELYVDLLLAGYLLESGLATCVVLHPKNIPWFVSDVVPADFAALLSALADPDSFFSSSSQEETSKTSSSSSSSSPPLSASESTNLQSLFQSLSSHHANGSLLLRPNPFWTHAGSFWRLPTTAPALHSDLRTSLLTIWKGDLNYRKLTGDAAWDPTTPFATALGPLGAAGSGVRVLALRTCKADVVVGLEKGKDEELRESTQQEGEREMRKWAWSGKWAVVQFWDGKRE